MVDNNWYETYKNKAVNNIEKILSILKIEYSITSDNIIGIRCPIHDSSTIGNSLIYLNSGIWLCFSSECNCDYGKSVLGLIKGTLEKSKLPASWNDVKNIIDSMSVGEIDGYTVKYTPPALFRDESTKPPTTIPSLYFLKKGYNPETLIKYEVGDCHKAPFDNRAIIPVRYINGEYMGFTSRIHWNECPLCKYYHSKYSVCINSDHDFHFMFKKSYHSKGLQKSKTLYGIDKIANKGLTKLAIVEGPGCVWKLAEYGIPAVAALGKDFSQLRLKLLENLNIKDILFIADKDQAGEEFKNRFIKDYSNSLNIFLPHLTQKDVGEMSDEDIKKYVVRKWESI